MKTSSSPYTYSLPRLIETEGLHKTYHRLCELAFTLMDDSRALLANAHDIARAARALIKAETHNDRIITKWEILLTPSWRKRVLRDLGGLRALRRWERRSDRAARRRAGLPMLKPHASAAQREARTANLAKAKAALKAKHHKGVRRACWDNTHPNIFLDRVKVDMEGLFRLAPIQRGARVVKTKVKVKPRRLSSAIEDRAPQTVTSERRLKYTKLYPISLWPIEFEALGDFKYRSPSVSVTPSKSVFPDEGHLASPIARDLGLNHISQHVGLGPRSPRFNSKRSGGNDNEIEVPTLSSVIPALRRDQLSNSECGVGDAHINVPEGPKTDSSQAEELSIPRQARDDIRAAEDDKVEAKGDSGEPVETPENLRLKPDKAHL